jgi:hypothetical protein
MFKSVMKPLLLNLCSNSYSTAKGRGVATCVPSMSGEPTGGRGRAAVGWWWPWPRGRSPSTGFSRRWSSPPSGDGGPLLQVASSFNRTRVLVLSSKRQQRLTNGGGRRWQPTAVAAWLETAAGQARWLCFVRAVKCGVWVRPGARVPG